MELSVIYVFIALLFGCLLQIVIWFVIPAVRNSTAAHANHTLSLIVLLQYIPRFFLIFPLNRRIAKTTGVIAKTAWAGAAYNLLLYMLASHVRTYLPILLYLLKHLVYHLKLKRGKKKKKQKSNDKEYC